MPEKSKTLRVANCSGFYGDRLAAAREMIEGGPIDYLTGDYLAELTLLILHKARQKDPTRGYATTFLRQMEDVLGLALERGVRIVTDAGGLNPAGLADALRSLAERLGVRARIAHVEGDDVLAKIPALQRAGEEMRHLDTGEPLGSLSGEVLSANAYLGAWGVVEALGQGADIVVCPRVTDASLVVGPAAYHFGWARTDWDRLAGAVATGHVLECGAQATGGNYAFFREVRGLEHPGFPLAEIHADGSSVITKHPGTGGLVSVGTVTAQLLYEIDGPRYMNPDVVARFDTIRLEQEGTDRVRMFGVQGEPAPAQVKVCINYVGGYRNTMTLVLTGLDIEAKADLARRTLIQALGGEGACRGLEFDLVRSDKEDAATNAEASAFLRVTAKAGTAEGIGRQFSSTVIEMILSSYPGFFCTTPPQDAAPYGVYWPTLLPADVPEHTTVGPDGRRVAIAPAPTAGGTVTVAPLTPPDAGGSTARDAASDAGASESAAARAKAAGATKRLPLGTIFGARSGDKGGNANVGVWARSDAAHAWLVEFLTVERFKVLLPETAALPVRRFAFPHLRALNFVVVGLLGEGVASSTRSDPQAKSFGEYLRSREVDLPTALLGDAPE